MKRSLMALFLSAARRLTRGMSTHQLTRLFSIAGPLSALVLASCAPPMDDVPPDPSAPTPALNVVEREEPGREWNCEEGWADGRSTCYQGYVDLAMESIPLDVDLEFCRDDESRLIQEVAEGTVAVKPLLAPSASELATEITEALDLGVWASDIDTRLLDIYQVDEFEQPWGWQRMLQFEDPLLGTNEVWELWPDTDESVPLLIALPGHPDGTHAAEEMTESLGLGDYVDAGYGLLVLDTQAYDTGNAEHYAAASMLCGGRSMMAVRAYEVLLLHKYARHLQATGRTTQSFGLLGHSGGSIAAHMLTRFFYDFGAVATDLKSNYLGRNDCSAAGDSGVCLLDEAFIPLHRLSQAINDSANPPPVVPTYETEYGYPEGSQPVIDFFDTHLHY
jgi:hypothetical protein